MTGTEEAAPSPPPEVIMREKMLSVCPARRISSLADATEFAGGVESEIRFRKEESGSKLELRPPPPPPPLHPPRRGDGVGVNVTGV